MLTMKCTIILLLLLELSPQDIYCNDDILSKFHQNTYKIREVRTQLMSYNEDRVNIFELKTFKYNRTTPAINATLNIKLAVKDQVEVLVQCYKFLSNEYRHFPIRFQVSLTKAVKANAVGLQAVKKCGNITNFYFEKDTTYYLCNFVIDDTHLPPLIPIGKYKVDLTYLYLNEELAVVAVFAEVYIPIAYPKK